MADTIDDVQWTKEKKEELGKQVGAFVTQLKSIAVETPVDTSQELTFEDPDTKKAYKVSIAKAQAIFEKE
jgi:hypothetical protein